MITPIPDMALPDLGFSGAQFLWQTFAFTVFNASVNALPIYMTNDTKSRSSAYSIRMIFAGLVQAVLSFLCLNIVNKLGGGQAAWIKLAAALATISLIASLLTYFGTKENAVPAEELCLCKLLSDY